MPLIFFRSVAAPVRIGLKSFSFYGQKCRSTEVSAAADVVIGSCSVRLVTPFEASAACFQSKQAVLGKEPLAFTPNLILTPSRRFCDVLSVRSERVSPVAWKSVCAVNHYVVEARRWRRRRLHRRRVDVFTLSARKMQQAQFS